MFGNWLEGKVFMLKTNIVSGFHFRKPDKKYMHKL